MFQAKKKEASYEMRQGLASEGCRYVTAQEFIELATSTKKLYRVDEADAGLCGLLDPVTGDRMVVERDKLFDAQGLA